MLQGYSLLFRLKTAKHTSNLGTEREAVAPIFARGWLPADFRHKGRTACAVPAYLLRVMVQGTLLLQADAIPSAVSPSRVAVMT